METHISGWELFAYMDKLLIFTSAILIIGFVFEFLRKKSFKQETVNFVKRGGYKKKDCVMDKREMAFFHELERQLPQGYYIFPKMRIIDMIDATQGQGLRYRKNKIMPKHVDFLICNSYFNPVLAIELNGNSHYRQDRADSDELKTKVFQVANLPLEVVNVGADFQESIQRIKSLIH
ncbi:DUF2726 domain-containing protein [Candidatus Nomurabacteria bacterium]|nr:DUF2726 domain-containing protein [Candidatus Nomurabacteria bacterium]